MIQPAGAVLKLQRYLGIIGSHVMWTLPLSGADIKRNGSLSDLKSSHFKVFAVGE
jgi:hypothetical protein